MFPWQKNLKPEFDFKNPADFKKLEKMAYDMTIEIENFPPAAYRYFDKLRTLYAEYKHAGLPKVEAQRRKSKLYSEYAEAVVVFDNCRATYAEYQDNIRKAGTLLSNIEKSHDTKEIALTACQVIGIMTGDDSFFKRQKSKIVGKD